MIPKILDTAQAIRQKAPSAKGCIKTWHRRQRRKERFHDRKHRAPKGALRRGAVAAFEDEGGATESTERQRVH